MKKIIILSTILAVALYATPLKLTPKEQKDWQIETAQPKVTKTLSVGKCIAEVVTPSQYLQSISLPFEAQVKKLYLSPYEEVKKGQLLAEVTGYEWIKLQKQFISDAIELKHHRHIAERKNRLCSEEIIPKKECTAANAEYQSDKIKVSASKALLRGYGANEKMISNLFNKLKISQTMPIRSTVTGKLIQLNIQAGKSTNPSDALFVIQKKGALWLEADMLVYKATKISDGERVTIKYNHETFESTLLLHAPTINVQNQTQKVRFSLPHNPKFITGMRGSIRVSINKQTLKVPKKSIINYDGEEILFVETEKGYEPTAIDILGEDATHYYLKDIPKLHAPVVTTSVAILKSLLESGNE